MFLSVPPAVVYTIGAALAFDMALILLLLKRYGDLVRAFNEGAPQPRAGGGLPVGARIPEFSVVGVTGETISRARLAGGGIVAFLSVQCAPCHEQAPRLASLAANEDSRRRPVLAVIAGPAEHTAEVLEVLGNRIPAVREDFHGPLARLFHVGRFPTYLEFDDDGLITGVVHTVDLLSRSPLAATA